MSSNFKGFIYGILAAASYGMNPAFALPLYEEGMSTTSVLCLRYAFALPILAIMMAVRGQSLKISLRKELLPIAVLGFLMGFSSLGLFLSYRYMPAGIASTILFVYPLMVAVIMAMVFKQKISQKTHSQTGYHYNKINYDKKDFFRNAIPCIILCLHGKDVDI